MSFDVLQGIFDADASDFIDALEDAADASEEFADASEDLEGDLDGLGPASSDASGGVEDLGSELENATDPAGEFATEVDETGESAADLTGPLEDAEGATADLGGAAGDAVGPLEDSSDALGEASDASEDAVGSLEPLQNEFDGAGDAAGGLGDAAGDATGPIEESADALTDAGDAGDGAADSLGPLQDEYEGVGGAAGDAADGSETASGAFADVGDSATDASGGVGDLSGAAADADGDLGPLGDSAADTSGSLDELGGSAADASGSIGDADFSGSADSLEEIGDAGESAADGLDDAAGGAADASDEFDDVSMTSDDAADSMWDLESAGMAAGGALMGMGAGAIGAIESTKDMRAELNQTGVTMGMTSDEANEMARDISDATFPIEDAVGALGELSALGPESEEALRNNALASDDLADATGTSATEIAGSLAPAIAALDGDLDGLRDPDAFVFAHHNTPLTIQDIASSLERLDFDMLKEMDMTSEDAALSMALFAEETGFSGKLLRTNYNQALNEADGSQEQFLDNLGLTEEEMQEYQEELSGSSELTNEYADAANDTTTIVDEWTEKQDDLLMQLGASSGQVQTAAATMGGFGATLAGVSSTAPMAAKGLGMVSAASLPLTAGLLVLAGAAAAVGYAWHHDIGGIQGTTEEAFGAVEERTRPLVNLLRNEFGETVRVLRTDWMRLTDAFDRGRERLEPLNPLFNAIGTTIEHVFVGAVDSGITAMRLLMAVVRRDFDAIETITNGWRARMSNRLNESGELFMRALRQGIDAVKDRVPEAIYEMAADVRALLPFSDAQRGPLSDLSSVGPNTIDTIANGIRNTAQRVPDAIYSMAEDVRALLPFSDAQRGPLSDLSSVGPAAVGLIADGIANRAHEVPSEIRSMASDVVSYLPPTRTGPLSNLHSRGSNIASGIASGLRSGLGAVGSAASSVADRISDYLPSSPARRGALALGPEERGESLSFDFARGIRAGIPRVENASQQLAEAASRNMDVERGTLEYNVGQGNTREMDAKFVEGALVGLEEGADSRVIPEDVQTMVTRSGEAGAISASMEARMRGMALDRDLDPTADITDIAQELARDESWASGSSGDWIDALSQISEDDLEFRMTELGGFRSDNITMEYDGPDFFGDPTVEHQGRGGGSSGSGRRRATTRSSGRGGRSGSGGGTTRIVIELADDLEATVKETVEDVQNVQIKKATNGRMA